jgi:hypothetical protein
MIAISLGEGRTLSIAGRGGMLTQVHFDTKGNPVALRIMDVNENAVVHKRSGCRVPRGWANFGMGSIEQHDLVEFQSKLRFALRRAICA